MLGWGSPAVDLPALLRLVLTFVAVASGLALLLRTAASRYFAVDSVVSALEQEEMARREEEEEKKCFVCGNGGIKVCSRCRSVRYCSLDCQSKHWKDDHKLKCRKQESTSMALVPPRGRSKVLRQPKKILFPYDEFMKLYYWDKQTFFPCGLLNCGNSCFANVVLQCLACTRPLVAYLLEGSHSYHCTRNVWCFLCELQTHIQTVTRSSQPFSPVKILSRLPNIGSHLGYGRQEDAHEFMRFAIDTMQSVCLDEFGGESVLDPSTQETSLIQHIFGGHLQSQVICTNCDKVSNRYENMMDLTVEIQGEGESLEDCLDQFTAKEWLHGENMYKCDGCNDYVKAWKRLTVHQPPNILTITLKRFQSGRFGKLNKRVAFPETLDLGPYMSAAGGGDNLYTLYAVVVHLDMLNASFFGHYICYVKNFSGNWYKIDDCKVSEVEVEEVLSQGAYMLLYNRLHVRPPKPIQQAEENVPQPAQVSPDISESMDTRINGELNSKSNSCTVSQEPDWMDTDEVGSASIDGDPVDGVERNNIRPREPKVGESLPRETKIVDIQEPSPRSDTVVHTVSESTSNSGRMNEIIGTSLEIAEVPAVSTSLNSREENLEADASSINNVNSKLVQPEVVPNPGSSYQNAIRNAASWYDDKKIKASAQTSKQSSSCPSETRPLFSRGFLDRQPSKKKPLQKVRVSPLEGSSVGISTSSNGKCNGFSKPIGLASVESEGSESSPPCPNVNNITRSSNVDLMCQTGNDRIPYEDGNNWKECSVSECSLTTFDKPDPNQKLKLGNHKEFLDFDMSFVSRGFPNKPCDQPQKNICITENGIRENGSIALEESCLIDSPQATNGKGNGSLNGLPFTSKRSIDISEVPQTYNGFGKTNSSGEHEVIDHPDQQNHMTDIAPSKESQLSELLLNKMT